MKILNGKTVADSMIPMQKARVESFRQKFSRAPKLVVCIIGENKASQVYVKNKHLACKRIGMDSEILSLPESISQNELISEVKKLNEDHLVDGILVQMPLPKHINSEVILQNINISKDVDGFTPGALGRLWSGLGGVAPCTPQGVMNILKHYQISVAGKNAVVVGRSLIVGRPMAELLLSADATVTICHSKTRDLKKHTLLADLVIVAAGKPEAFGKEYFSQGSVVIDVGIHKKPDGKICGDLKFHEIENWVDAVSPVPGGVGPMTIACLLDNTLTLAEQAQNK